MYCPLFSKPTVVDFNILAKGSLQVSLVDEAYSSGSHFGLELLISFTGSVIICSMKFSWTGMFSLLKV